MNNGLTAAIDTRRTSSLVSPLLHDRFPPEGHADSFDPAKPAFRCPISFRHHVSSTQFITAHTISSATIIEFLGEDAF